MEIEEQLRTIDLQLKEIDKNYFITIVNTTPEVTTTSTSSTTTSSLSATKPSTASIMGSMEKSLYIEDNLDFDDDEPVMVDEKTLEILSKKLADELNEESEDDYQLLSSNELDKDDEEFELVSNESSSEYEDLEKSISSTSESTTTSSSSNSTTNEILDEEDFIEIDGDGMPHEITNRFEQLSANLDRLTQDTIELLDKFDIPTSISKDNTLGIDDNDRFYLEKHAEFFGDDGVSSLFNGTKIRYAFLNERIQGISNSERKELFGYRNKLPRVSERRGISKAVDNSACVAYSANFAARLKKAPVKDVLELMQ